MDALVSRGSPQRSFCLTTATAGSPPSLTISLSIFWAQRVALHTFADNKMQINDRARVFTVILSSALSHAAISLPCLTVGSKPSRESLGRKILNDSRVVKTFPSLMPIKAGGIVPEVMSGDNNKDHFTVFFCEQ